MVTLALIAMCGMLGLAIDLGWSYFVHRNAQSYADSGALAATERALRTVGQAMSFATCPVGVACDTTDYACTAGVAVDPNEKDNGCIYLRGVTSPPYQGYVDGNNTGRTQTDRLDFGGPSRRARQEFM